MKIVCPSCHAQYEVPEAVQTSHRKMRCARCSGEWLPEISRAPEARPFDEAEERIPEAAAPADIHTPLQAAFVEADEVRAMAAPGPWDEPAPVVAHEIDPEPVVLHVSPPVPAPAPVSTRPPRAETPPARRVPAELVVAPARKGPPVLAWGASIALVALLLATSVIYRGPIMKAWPPSTRLFAALGLEQP